MNYLLLTTRLDTNRIFQSTELLKKIGVTPFYIWGAEKNNLNPDIMSAIVDPGGGNLTQGELAVALTHIKALKYVIETNEPAIIIEDDFRLWHEGEITVGHVWTAWKTIPDDTDFCSFAKWHVFNPPLEILDPIDQLPHHKRVTLPTFGNQCYYVSVKFARYFYDAALPIRCAADVIYRFPPDNHDFIYRHYFPELFWHISEGSIKD